MPNFCDLKSVIYELPRKMEPGEADNEAVRVAQLRAEIRQLQAELAQRQRLLKDRITELREIMKHKRQ